MKKIIALLLAVGLIAGCQAVGEVDEVVEVKEVVTEAPKTEYKEVIVSARATDSEEDVREYLDNVQKTNGRYLDLNDLLIDHYSKVGNDLAVMQTEEWKSELEEYYGEAYMIYAINNQAKKDEKVPPSFKEFHDLNVESFKYKHLSIKAHLDILDGEDFSNIEKSYHLSIVSGEKMKEANAIFQKMIETEMNK